MVPSQYLVTIEPHGRTPHMELSGPGMWLSCQLYVLRMLTRAHWSMARGSWGLLNGHFAQ